MAEGLLQPFCTKRCHRDTFDQTRISTWTHPPPSLPFRNLGLGFIDIHLSILPLCSWTWNIHLGAWTFEREKAGLQKGWDRCTERRNFHQALSQWLQFLPCEQWHSGLWVWWHLTNLPIKIPFSLSHPPLVIFSHMQLNIENDKLVARPFLRNWE